MLLTKSETCRRAFLAFAATILSGALTFGAAQAQDKTFVMKISTPTLNAAPDRFAKDFGAAVEKDSGGRIKAEVYPASQLGSIPRQIEGTQFGAIQCVVVPPEFFVGIDERSEVLAAPGLVSSMAQGQRVAADPEVLKLMLSIGGDKGLHGVGLFIAEPNEVIAKNAIRHVADFKGKKLRIFASDFQSVAFQRLGATPVAMSPGDVLAAIQQGLSTARPPVLNSLTGCILGTLRNTPMSAQSSIFIIAEVSKKWYDSLPADLQQIVDRAGTDVSLAIIQKRWRFSKARGRVGSTPGVN